MQRPIPKNQPLKLVHLRDWRLFTLGAVLAGGVDTGWTFYTPYSTTYSNGYVIATGVGASSQGFPPSDGVKLHCHDPQDESSRLTWFHLPLFIWAHYATSLIMMRDTGHRNHLGFIGS